MAWKKRERDGDFVKLGEDHPELIGSWKGTKEGKYGPLGIVETDDGEVVFPISAGLRDLETFEEGDNLKIVYEGTGTTKDGHEFKKFSLFEDDGAVPF